MVTIHDIGEKIRRLVRNEDITGLRDYVERMKQVRNAGYLNIDFGLPFIEAMESVQQSILLLEQNDKVLVVEKVETICLKGPHGFILLGLDHIRK